MLKDLFVVGGSVFTLLLLMAVGFVLGKLRILEGAALSQLSRVLLCVVNPALMINTMLKETCDGPTVRGLLISAGVLVMVYVLQGLLMILFFRGGDQEDRGVCRFASIYGNVGFMGVPLIQSVMGDSGMLTTVVSLVVFNLGIWTHGAWLVGGKGKMSVKKAFVNPGVIGMLIALALFALGVSLPGPVDSAVGYISSLNTPLAMVVIGAQMASVELKKLFRDKRLYGVSAVKLLLIPGLVMLVLLPLGLDPTIYTAVVILSACPTAGASSLMCQMAGKDTSMAARLVTLTTILSIITLPAMSALAKAIAGI